jgi:hypothetical protein
LFLFQHTVLDIDNQYFQAEGWRMEKTLKCCMILLKSSMLQVTNRLNFTVRLFSCWECTFKTRFRVSGNCSDSQYRHGMTCHEMASDCFNKSYLVTKSSCKRIMILLNFYFYYALLYCIHVRVLFTYCSNLHTDWMMKNAIFST